MNQVGMTRRRVNRGGNIAIPDVVGRDALIASIWRVLDSQSVLLVAERRMGKSSIARKMEAEAIGGALAIHRNLENVATPAEFIERIWEDVGKYLSKQAQAGGWLRKLAAAFGGTEIGGVLKLPPAQQASWKSILEQTIGALADNNQGRLIVFLWDEMPLMLDKFKRRDKKDGESTAMDMLDELRHLRQTHDSIRMIFTGSIGLHHVITALRQADYGNEPTNDMHSVDVPALSQATARELALSLIWGELEGKVVLPDPDALAARIAISVDNLPFFIHQTVGYFADHLHEFSELTPEHVDDGILECLTAAHDPWKLRHYTERINKHYTTEERPFVNVMLNALAMAPEPLTFPDLFNHLKQRHPTEDEEGALTVLKLLQQDHYVKLDRSGAYHFCYPLIARSWCYQRGLPMSREAAA